MRDQDHEMGARKFMVLLISTLIFVLVTLNFLYISHFASINFSYFFLFLIFFTNNTSLRV